jgi:hypothetical protein
VPQNDIIESNRIQLVLFGTQNRSLHPYFEAINRRPRVPQNDAARCLNQTTPAGLPMCEYQVACGSECAECSSCLSAVAQFDATLYPSVQGNASAASQVTASGKDSPPDG